MSRSQWELDLDQLRSASTSFDPASLTEAPPIGRLSTGALFGGLPTDATRHSVGEVRRSSCGLGGSDCVYWEGCGAAADGACEAGRRCQG